MRKRSPFLVLFALLAVAAALAGCGGGGSSSDTSGSTGDSTESTEEQSGGSTESSGSAPTKAAFIKEADKVCGDAESELNTEIEAFAKDNGIDIEEEPSDQVQEELFQEIVLPNIAKQGEELAALTPPEGDESTIEDLTDTLEEEVSEAEDEGGLPDKDTLNGATEKAKAYGLKTCGS